MMFDIPIILDPVPVNTLGDLMPRDCMQRLVYFLNRKTSVRLSLVEKKAMAIVRHTISKISIQLVKTVTGATKLVPWHSMYEPKLEFRPRSLDVAVYCGVWLHINVSSSEFCNLTEVDISGVDYPLVCPPQLKTASWLLDLPQLRRLTCFITQITINGIDCRDIDEKSFKGWCSLKRLEHLKLLGARDAGSQFPWSTESQVCKSGRFPAMPSLRSLSMSLSLLTYNYKLISNLNVPEVTHLTLSGIEKLWHGTLNQIDLILKQYVPSAVVDKFRSNDYAQAFAASIAEHDGDRTILPSLQVLNLHLTDSWRATAVNYLFNTLMGMGMQLPKSVNVTLNSTDFNEGSKKDYISEAGTRVLRMCSEIPNIKTIRVVHKKCKLDEDCTDFMSCMDALRDYWTDREPHAPHIYMRSNPCLVLTDLKPDNSNLETYYVEKKTPMDVYRDLIYSEIVEELGLQFAKEHYPSLDKFDLSEITCKIKKSKLKAWRTFTLKK
jgi:hypothetical protein